MNLSTNLLRSLLSVLISVFLPCPTTSVDSTLGEPSYPPGESFLISLQNRRGICFSKPPHSALLLETSHSNPLISFHLYLYLPRSLHIVYHSPRRDAVLHHAPLLPNPTSTTSVSSTQRSLPTFGASTSATNQDPASTRTVQGFLPQYA